MCFATVPPSTPPCFALQCMLARLQTRLTLPPQGRHYNRTSGALNSERSRPSRCQTLPHPSLLIFKKAVDHTCSRSILGCGNYDEGEWHRMCYLLRSCDAAFLWQHSTRCYSHFAVFSLTASYSPRQSGSCEKGQQEWTGEREPGKEGKISHLIPFCTFSPKCFCSLSQHGYYGKHEEFGNAPVLLDNHV